MKSALYFLKRTFFCGQCWWFYIFKCKNNDDFYILKCKKLANICILKCKNLINDKYLFEVGGKKKNFDQIADVADSFLAVDDTEVGHGNRIPLWMFGMVY